MSKIGFLLAAALLVLVLVAASGLATPADPIAQRREAMRTMAESVRTIAWMFEGRVPYDRGRGRGRGDAIHNLSGSSLTSGFAAGTLGQPSRAKPEIAPETEEFAALAEHLQEVAAVCRGRRGRTNSYHRVDEMGSGSAMGNPLFGNRRTAPQRDLAQMPMEHLLHLMIADCGSCHAKFRANVV